MRNSKSAEELWTGKPSKWTGRHLIEFGRVGLVTIKSAKAGKLKDKSEPMLIVGYAKEYPVGTYRLYNPKTKRVVVSDSVQWTKFKRWNITPELEGVFAIAKNKNKTGLETYDELGQQQTMFYSRTIMTQ